MLKNVATKLYVYCWDSTTGLPKTGDAANLTAYAKIDAGSVTALADTSATEVDATNSKGWYQFDLTQGETNGDLNLYSCKSTTSNIVCMVPEAVTRTLPTTGVLAPSVAGRTLVVDSAGLADATAVKLGPTGAATAQTARDIGASVLLSSGTGTGQLKLASGYVAMTWADIAAPTTTVALTGTTIAATQKVDVDTIKTNPVVNGGTFTFPTNSTGASTTNITGGTITTVTTVTNQLTAAQIATGVWQDTTAGDFTTASSPGKILVAQLGGAFTTTSSSVYSVASLANAPTGGSAPTVSQIATAVWQDATGSDFTAAGSIGKSLFTSGNAPGAASGLALVGSNVGTASSVSGTVGGIAGTTTTFDALQTALSSTHGGGSWANVTVSDKTGFSLVSTGLDLVLVAGVSVPVALRRIGATTAGLLPSGAGTTTETWQAFDGTSAVSFTLDSSGNRTSVIYS